MQREAAVAFVENSRPFSGIRKNANINVLITPDMVEVKNALPAIVPGGDAPSDDNSCTAIGPIVPKSKIVGVINRKQDVRVPVFNGRLNVFGAMVLQISGINITDKLARSVIRTSLKGVADFDISPPIKYPSASPINVQQSMLVQR